ncbi:hypothetical protein FOZ61_002590, partial [Perkinsus olseni]
RSKHSALSVPDDSASKVRFPGPLASPRTPLEVASDDGSEYSAVSSYRSEWEESGSAKKPRIDRRLEGLFGRLDLLERPMPEDLAAMFGVKAATEYCRKAFNSSDAFSVQDGREEAQGEAVSPAALEWALAAQKLTALRGVNLRPDIQELLVTSRKTPNFMKFSKSYTLIAARSSRVSARGSSTEPDTGPSRVQLSMTLELEGIGISLIDSAPEELLYVRNRSPEAVPRRHYAFAGDPRSSWFAYPEDEHSEDALTLRLSDSKYFKTLLHTKVTTSSRKGLGDLLPVMAEPSFQ